ncbi:MAG TPA: cytochrome c oxidase assembly protein [Cellulomonas sp.]|nr:cytochrome c oxidase assembly protein [Cellulomonas sp.]
MTARPPDADQMPDTARTPSAHRGATPSVRVGVLAAAGAAAALLGVWFSGAALPTMLRDPGALVRWGLPATKTLSELAGALTLGALVLTVGVLPRRQAAPTDRYPTPAAGLGDAYPRALLVAGVAAATWTVLSLATLVLTYANIAGLPLDAPTFGQEIGDYVSSFDLGRAQLMIVVVAAVASALALVVGTPTGAAWVTALVVVALWQQAQTGHAAGAASHDVATSSMFLHLVGAAVWIGALGALTVLARRLGRDVGPAAARYSVVAGWCLAAVGASGLVNAVIRVGGFDGLATRYGVLVLVKALLLVVLGALGLAHRRAAIPRLTVADGAGRLFWRLVLVELAVMGAVSGVAVALASSAPPVPQTAVVTRTPAVIVTGHPLPPEPTTMRWLTQWRWDVVLSALAVAGIVVYVRWAWRLHRRGDAWPVSRTISWVVGMLLFFWTTNGGPAVYGHVLFSAHMLEHMVLATVIPIFLALAAPVTLALRALPVRHTVVRGDASRGPREWILVLVHSRWGRFFAHPLVAAGNFAGSMIAFYFTGIFEWTLRSPVGHLAMAVHFSLVGYLFVNALIGVDPGPTRPAYPQRLLLLFATMAFHAFFGVTLMSGDALLAADWFGLLGRPWGPTALADQQTGGGIAWGIGELPTLALAVAVAVSWSRADDRTARRRDRKVDREGDVELDEYNAMLARMARHDDE